MRKQYNTYASKVSHKRLLEVDVLSPNKFLIHIPPLTPGAETVTLCLRLVTICNMSDVSYVNYLTVTNVLRPCLLYTSRCV